MKIAIIGNTNNPVTKKANDPYSWFVLTHAQGFELIGHEVKLIDYKSNSLTSIKNKLEAFRPSYVFTHLTFHNTVHNTSSILELFSSLYKKYDIKFIHSCGDARTSDRYTEDVSDAFFSAFVGTHAMVDNCALNLKIPTFYAPYSSLTYNNIAEPISQYRFKKPVFTGSPNAHNDRREFIKILQEYGAIKIFKTQSGEDLRKRTPELSSSASSILGLCTGYELDGYADVRWAQYLGTGACMIMRKFKNMDDIIPPDLYYPFEDYSRKSAEYVKKLSMQVLKEDTWPMRCKAFRFIQKYHSSVVRMQQILDVLEGKKQTVL